VRMTTDHFVERIDGAHTTLFNVYRPDAKFEVDADWVVMATGRRSENAIYHALRERNVSVEAIGDAVAPRGTYEAVYEGHRAARKL
jgi:hypothetical protein